MEDDIQNYLPTVMFRGTPVDRRRSIPIGRNLGSLPIGPILSRDHDVFGLTRQYDPTILLVLMVRLCDLVLSLF